METPHNPLEGDRPDLSFDLRDANEEQVSIIIVHNDRPEYLNICLQSIAVNSINNNYEIIVVDNNSGKETQEFLDSIEEDVKIVRNKKNLYWSESCNLGVEAADQNSKYLIFMHHDVVVLSPSWIDLFINIHETHNAGYIGLEMQSYTMAKQKVDFIQEWCMMITRECWEDIKPWPVGLPQIGHSFIMTMKAAQNGYKPQMMQNQCAHHYKVFALDINDYERQVEQAMVTMPQLLKEVQAQAVAVNTKI